MSMKTTRCQGGAWSEGPRWEAADRAPGQRRGIKLNRQTPRGRHDRSALAGRERATSGGTGATLVVRCPDHTQAASRLSLARGAMGAAPCKAPVGDGAGGPRAGRGHRAPAAGAAAPHPMPGAPRDSPAPPLRTTDLHSPAPYLRPAPRASAGTSRGVPARGGRDAGRHQATQTTPPATEAGAKEEIR
jgi:hypothetical protein